MDRIYSKASLVIIAAAGEDPHYGLPGVSTRSRCIRQRVVETGQYKLVEMFPDVRASLAKSPWRSRAWTFQEGYLAKRRLIFTDEQVAYVCNYCTLVESITTLIPHDTANRDWRSGMLFFTDKSHAQSSWWDVLSEYTNRDLSYDSDALNACSGIFNFLAKRPWSDSSDIPVHLWGQSDLASCCGLNWHHEKPGLRRPEFPSWSWLGWKGPIENTPFNIASASIEVSQGKLGLWTPAKEYFKKLRTSSMHPRDAPRILRLTGICKCFRFDREKDGSIQTGRMPCSSTTFYPCQVYLDEDVSPEIDYSDWIAMLLNYGLTLTVSTTPDHDSSNADFLLLRPTADSGVYERVGLMRSARDSEPCDEEWTLPYWEDRIVTVE
jgi:hypothetical protein